MEKLDGNILIKSFISAYQNLELHKEEVNALNVFPVPDGDTGTNMSLTMRSAAKQLRSLDSVSIKSVVKAVSNGSLMGARGNSGVILSQILRGFASGAKKYNEFTVEAAKEAFSGAYQSAYKAVMKPTEGTMLTVIRKMGEFAETNYENYNHVIDFLKDILNTGELALEETPEQLPVLKEAGVVDAGGKGLCYIFEGFIHYDKAPELIEEQRQEEKPKVQHVTPADDIKFGYCTEFLIHSDEDFVAFRDKISSYGDSEIVVGADGIIKTHIHTNNPGKVLEEAIKLGSLSDIKIDNMRIQHEHLIVAEDELESTQTNEKYGFIAVSSGEGLDEIFNQLEVDKIISGGQTMNPSTEDLVNAVNQVRADHIFIFPNNKNIILTAKQAQQISDKSVYVIESKSIPEAYTAILAFDEESSPDENYEQMQESIQEVKTGEITTAVRDTTVEGVPVKKDDYLCILDNKIISSQSDIKKIFKALCEKAIDDEVSIVTVYEGKDTDEETTKIFENLMDENYPDIDITVLKGNQPVYSYLISFE